MKNTASLNRENKKNQLRHQIVSSNTAAAAVGGREPEEDSEEILRRAHRRVRKRRFLILLVVAALLAGGFLAFYRYNQYHFYTDYQVIWEKSFFGTDEEGMDQSGDGFVEYESFADGLLKYTRDGISYLDSSGKVIWNQSYEMKSPIISINGEFAAVADQQGTSIYICDKSGCQGQATTQLPVLRVTVSAKGVVAALQEDSAASYIQLYRKDGSSLEISVKSLLSGDGTPVDISLSPSGTQLLTTFLYLENGLLKSKVVFYNFGLGKDDPKRIVGILFDEDLNGSMVARVRFLDDSHGVIFADKALFFASTRVETEPDVGEGIPIEEEIRSICYSDRYVGVITDNSDGENAYRLRIYNADGTLKMEQTFDFQYTGVTIDGELVCLYNDSGCQVYNMKGIMKFSGTFDFVVSNVIGGRFPGTLLVSGPQLMKEIRLQ